MLPDVRLWQTCRQIFTIFLSTRGVFLKKEWTFNFINFCKYFEITPRSENNWNLEEMFYFLTFFPVKYEKMRDRPTLNEQVFSPAGKNTIPKGVHCGCPGACTRAWKTCRCFFEKIWLSLWEIPREIRRDRSEGWKKPKIHFQQNEIVPC